MLTASATPGATLASTCPSCGHTEATDILTVADAPVMVATVFRDAATARQTPTGTIHLVGCLRCGLLFNRDFDLDKALAGARYESSQASSAHFGSYTETLAKEWVERHGLHGKRVIEVGCGQGDFMFALLAAGVGMVHGIDPLAQPADIPAEFADRVTVDATDFAAPHTLEPAAALVCRHTIEHVPDVAGFLRSVAAWSRHNGGAPVLFEAPATERIVDEGAFWDIYYEHCNYFTLDSLSVAFEQAGLRVDQREVAYGAQYLLLDASCAPTTVAADAAGEPDASGSIADPFAWIGDAVRFGTRAAEAVTTAREQMIDHGAGPGGVVIWQGAAKTVGLLTSLGPDVPIRSAVDMNTRRHGFHLPPTGLGVLSPDALSADPPDHVILMNPVYATEVRSMLDDLGCTDTVLHTIDSVCRMGGRQAG